MTGYLIAAVVAVLLTWSLATRTEKARRAHSDLLGAKRLVRTAREVFWHAVGKLIEAALAPLAVVALLVTLYLIGRR